MNDTEGVQGGMPHDRLSCIPISIPGTNKKVVIEYSRIEVEHRWGLCDLCEKWRMLTQESGLLIAGEGVGFKCDDLVDTSCELDELGAEIPRNLGAAKRREIYSELEKACVEAYIYAQQGKAMGSDLALFSVMLPEGTPESIATLFNATRKRLLAVDPQTTEYPEEVKLVRLMHLEKLFQYCSLPLPSVNDSNVNAGHKKREREEDAKEICGDVGDGGRRNGETAAKAQADAD